MDYRKIKILADELNLEVEDELQFCDQFEEWTLIIDPKEGFSFGCQYHAASFVLRDKGKKLSKSQVWKEVAKSMKYEADELSECSCGFWKSVRS